MEKIYSKYNEGKLLHCVFRKENFKEGRQDLIDSDEFLQCAALQLNAGKTFRPHKHFMKEIEYTLPQESWVVIQGSVKCFFYDFDDKLIETKILKAGDASFTLYAGHTYEILEDNTLVYEMKSGPYFGQTADKTFID